MKASRQSKKENILILRQKSLLESFDQQLTYPKLSSNHQTAAFCFMTFFTSQVLYPEYK